VWYRRDNVQQPLYGRSGKPEESLCVSIILCILLVQSTFCIYTGIHFEDILQYLNERMIDLVLTCYYICIKNSKYIHVYIHMYKDTIRLLASYLLMSVIY